ncbi:F-box/FBD/LRR-repeat protein At4g26340-like [Lotus japonicus]|uniref:F-box/FBD/LRR-repeat protein At4g26340-like n=1 Tax=Lotus japonicus TaxID=34305 RepID=UPI0025910019|nr:F-box/FBD/LRR-repeat protein At4g26340-like [Lotus japonicus]
MEDMISHLSDDILCHILSFLPTEQAIATSVLSKRWRSLWISVPVLNYDNQTYLKNLKPSYCFERLIYATILARGVQRPIRTFRLKYEVFHDERANADINVWVDTVIQRGVENMDIEIEFDPQYLGYEYIICLSPKILSCKTLVALKLKEVSLTASSFIELPSLKSLDLETVKFQEPQYFMDLLCGCPMLEDLKINWLDYEYSGPVCKERVKNLPELVKADIRFIGLEYMNYDSTNYLLEAISNVEILTIQDYEEFGVDVGNAVAGFSHLRHLVLTVPFVKKSHWVLLMLKNCPKLQSFTLDISFQAEDVLPYPDFAPECLTLCLTKCYLKCYGGRENDLKLAKHILKNSTYLQSMKICCGSRNPLEVLKELAFCPRKSASCELSFY